MELSLCDPPIGSRCCVEATHACVRRTFVVVHMIEAFYLEIYSSIFMYLLFTVV